MALVDKMQAAFDKLTKDDTRLNSAEVAAIQQAMMTAHLGYIKNHAYAAWAEDEGLRNLIREVNDEFIGPALDKPRRFLEKANVPFADLDPKGRTQAAPPAGRFLTDREIVLDAMYWLQASVTAAQAGSLVAVRGDVRDFFLTQRDQGMDHWRKLAMIVYRLVPNAIPPQVQAVGPSSP